MTAYRHGPTAEDLRRMREARERVAADDERLLAEAAAQDDRRRDCEAFDRIEATWRDFAARAASHQGVRFAVVAQVVGRHADPHVSRLRELIGRGGYRADLIRPPGYPHTLEKALDGVEGEVVVDGARGWRPASIPRLGRVGDIAWVVARW